MSEAEMCDGEKELVGGAGDVPEETAGSDQASDSDAGEGRNTGEDEDISGPVLYDAAVLPEDSAQDGVGKDISETVAGQPEAGIARDEADFLAEARAEAAEHYDRFLRASAELDNLRKRTARVRTEVRESTLRDSVLQIAPLLDNMRRALGQDGADFDALQDGISLIYNQFKEILSRFGLEEIEAAGESFDPNLHEAMMEVPDSEKPPGTIVEEMERGYKLNGKVVRAARVIVSKAEGG